MKKNGRVALLCNMNNNFFNLARYLRDMQYDAHLFILPYEPDHFLPEADTYTSEYSLYAHKLSWGNAFDLLTTSVAQIKKDVGDFDFYIACGSAPAYLAKAGIIIDLMVPYGADLYDIAFFKLVRPTKLWHYYVFTKYQRLGIKTSKNLTLADNADLFKDSLAKIGFNGNRLYSGIPYVYTNQYSPERIADFYVHSKYYPAFNKIRNEFDLVIFHHSRHCWKNEPDPIALKDNDKLFRGLANFLQQNQNKKIAIVTFEYGHDANASKELCKDLGIEQHVFWFPLMPRKDLMIGMSLSDIVAGEFRNSWFTYGVVFEAMALAKPVMHYRDDTLYQELELYPMIYAKETHDITKAINTYSINKDALQLIGEQAKAWLYKNIVNKSLEEISSIFKNKK